MTESNLEETALHAEMMMRQEVGDQGGYQQALQKVQKFDDLRKRAITLIETLDAMAATARFVERRQIFQVHWQDRRLKRAAPSGTRCGAAAVVSKFKLLASILLDLLMDSCPLLHHLHPSLLPRVPPPSCCVSSLQFSADLERAS